MRAEGQVAAVRAGVLVVRLPAARVGERVIVRSATGSNASGEVCGLEGSDTFVVLDRRPSGLAVGDVCSAAPASRARLGVAYLGRAFDATGTAIDGGASLPAGARAAAASAPAVRPPIAKPFWTGIRAIDGLLTIGCGARLGIFGPAGCGKTTLLEAIGAASGADAVVLALVGERGVEAQRWLARLDRRTTIVCATAACAAAERVAAAELALTQAEALRERGLQVVLVLDSLARYASALRERAVACGEPVGRAGYPASVWTALAALLERAGARTRGSVTLLATVLSDAQDNDPLTEAARSLLDGHIVLARELAERGHFPAIDVVASLSRTMPLAIDAAHAQDAGVVRAALARLNETRDQRALGLLDPGDAALSRVMAREHELAAFLQQRERTEPDRTRAWLAELAVGLRESTS